MAHAALAVPCLLAMASAAAPSQPPGPADIVLHGGRVYTMDEKTPWASTVVIEGNRIRAVLADGSFEEHLGPDTRVIDLQDRFLLPGFTDAHVHFEAFASRLAAIDLMPVGDDEALAAEVARIAAYLDPGEWITGGFWEGDQLMSMTPQQVAAYGSDRWMPDRWTIDEVSENHPALLQSFDGQLYLANTVALRAAEIEWEVMEGMEADEYGDPTGLIWRGSPALIRLFRVTKPKSDKRVLDEVRAAFPKLAERGITEIHDMTSQPQTRRYVRLQLAGELTARVWMRPHLLNVEQVVASGARMGHHPVTGERDRYLRWGAFVGHIDGTLFEQTALLHEPYSDRSSTNGRYRQCSSSHPLLREPDTEKLDRFLRLAADAGFTTDAHAAGPRAVTELLAAYARLQENLGKPLQRYGVIHAQVIRPQELPSFSAVHAIAVVNPFMIEDAIGWTRRRLGPDRETWSFPFRSLLEQGVALTFGSDAPEGARDNHPRLLIHAAVNRTRVDGTPEGGWIPAQRIPIEEALRALTVNAAFASSDEDVRGKIAPGMLADLVVLDRNPLEIAAREILEMNVVLTMVDGKIVFEAANR